MSDPVLVDFDSLFPPSLQRIVDDQRGALPAAPSYGPDCDPRTITDHDSEVQEQDGPDCTSFATIAAMENLLGGHVKLSERTLWHLQKKQKKPENITSAVEAAQSWVPAKKDAERLDRGRCRIGQAIQIGLDWPRLVAAIDHGHPCVVGMQTPRELVEKRPVVESNSGFVNRGHALAVVGYRVTHGEPYFLVKNSWGITTGDKGYQWVSFRLFHGPRGAGYAFFIEIASVEDRLNGWKTEAPAQLGVGSLLADPVAGVRYRVQSAEAGVISVVRADDEH